MLSLHERTPAVSGPRVLVCEKSGRWAVALRRALGEGGHRVVETRSFDQCWQALDESPASFVALEMTVDSAETVVRRLVDLRRRFRHARAAVLAARGLALADESIGFSEPGLAIASALHESQYARLFRC